MKISKNYEAVCKYCLAVLLVIASLQIYAQPNFNIAGFATQNGGTTGGQGGPTVTVNNYNDLKSYAESASTYIIMVEGTITNGAGGGQIRVKSNKSIIGVGNDAFLSGVGIDISSHNNIIIQNLKITLVGTSTPANVNGGDCIGISGTSKNIWIDHCELYSENPDVQTDIDKYDGLIDIKEQSGFITISWCYLHDHHKGCLVGASDSDLYSDRKITYHHNYFNKVKLRVPMYRGSTGHFFNNYIYAAKSASEIRAGTCVRVEKNYYESFSENAIYTPNDARGYTERIDNYLSKSQSRPYPGNCTASIPYDYSSFLTTNTNDVKTLVTQYAGVGVIGQSNDPTNAFSTIEAEDFSSQSGIQTEACGEGGLNVGYINNGDYLVFNDVDFGSAGASQLVARAATNGQGGTIQVRLDGTSGTQIGTLAISGTGGWQTYSDFTANVSQVPGVHDLYLVFEGGSGYLFNLNKFYFNEASVGGTSITIQESTTGFCAVDGTVDSDNSGFTGSGYANTVNAVGAGVDYKVSFSNTGLYQFEFRYASNSGRPAKLLINDQTVVSHIDFPSTGDWSTFTTVSAIALVDAGVHNVRIEATQSAGLGNIDFMKVSGDTPAPASCSSGASTLTIQENTTGFCGLEGTVDSDNAGYTGSGFANTTNVYGAGIDWEISAPSAGNYSLTWRYANGSGTNRDGLVIINNSTQAPNVSFPATGSWTTWNETSSINVTLSAGVNTIRLEANSSSGLANIDYMEISGINPLASPCNSSSKVASIEKHGVKLTTVYFYPNPVEETLYLIHLNDDAAPKDLRIYNLSGKVVKQLYLDKDEGQIKVGALKEGIYFLEVDGVVQGRFIKK